MIVMRTVLVMGFIVAVGSGGAFAANPTSNQESNILPGSPAIASQLPAPQVATDTVGSYLDAASAALMAGRMSPARSQRLRLPRRRCRVLERRSEQIDETNEFGDGDS